MNVHNVYIVHVHVYTMSCTLYTFYTCPLYMSICSEHVCVYFTASSHDVVVPMYVLT